MAEGERTANNREGVRRIVHLDEGSLVEAVARLREESRRLAKDSFCAGTALQQGGEHEGLARTGQNGLGGQANAVGQANSRPIEGRMGGTPRKQIAPRRVDHDGAGMRLSPRSHQRCRADEAGGRLFE